MAKSLKEHLLEEIKYTKDGTRLVDTHIVLDTFRKEPSDSDLDRGIIAWNLSVNGITTEDKLGIRHPLNRIVEIEIKEFTMPIPDPVPYKLGTKIDGYDVTDGVYINLSTKPVPMTHPPTSNPFESTLAQSPYDKHITLYIKETGMQSISDIAGRRHNFDLRLMSFNILGTSQLTFNMCQAIPKQDVVQFADPITDLSRITLEFKNPDTALRFLPDCYYNVDVRMVSSCNINGHKGNPLDNSEGTVWNLTLFITNFCISNGDNLGLVENDRIYVTGFNSSNVSLNKYMNSVDGLLIGKNVTDPIAEPDALYPFVGASDTNSIYAANNCFVLNPNITGVSPAGSQMADFPPPFWFDPQRVTVYVPKRRIRIPMRFRSMVKG